MVSFVSPNLPPKIRHACILGILGRIIIPRLQGLDVVVFVVEGQAGILP